ncbi:hypothetical protein ABIC21_000506 [Pseudarthrobacter sp. PvP090]
MVNRPIGYWVKRLDASLETHFDSTLARLHLTRRQWHVLTALNSGSLTPVEAGDILRPLDSDDGDARERDMAALVRRRLVILFGWSPHADRGRLRTLFRGIRTGGSHPA